MAAVRPDSPARTAVLEDVDLLSLWTRRVTVDDDIRSLRDYKTMLDAELVRRFREAHPLFDENAAGGRDLAEDDLIITLTWDRTFEYDEQCLLALAQALTATEYSEAIKWVAKPNRTVLNGLAKRGGQVAELITKATILKNARPDFKAKARR